MDSGYESTSPNPSPKGKSRMDSGYESTSLNPSPKGKSKMESMDSGYESTSPNPSPKGKSKMESMDSGYESTSPNPSPKRKSKMESMDSGYESTSPNLSPKGKSKMESIDFWFKKPTPKEDIPKRISKCFISTENEKKYSVVETTITNAFKKKNGKYSASESFDDSNTSETSNSGKKYKLTNPNHYAMPKGYSPPEPDCLPTPPSSWLPEIESTNTESCEMSNGFESTTFDSLLIQPSFFTSQ